MTPEEAAAWTPSQPNMLVTGTPGVGKSTLCSALSTSLHLQHIDVGQYAISRELIESYDDVRRCHILDEDAVVDALEHRMATGGVILDHHSCSWFPERWVQLVVIVRASTEVLYDRLLERGYAEGKIRENIEAEVFQVVADEARESYPKARILELGNDKEENKEAVLAEIAQVWNSLVHEKTNGQG